MDEISELKRKIERQTPPSIETVTPEVARISVEAFYDFQDVRKSMMNRIRDVVRKKREGIPFDEVEEEKEDRNYSKEYADENLPELIEAMFNGEDEKFNEQDVHEDFSQEEYDYLKKILNIAEASQGLEDNFEALMDYFTQEPIFQRFLKHVNGIGPVMTANLIRRIEYCEDYGPHVSNLWSYAGLAPGQERKKGEQANYNVDLRTLCWKISEQLIKGNSLYKQYFYDPYKEEQLEKMEKAGEGKEDEFEGSPPSSRGHAHNRAKRYMVKKFLKHYWIIARSLKNLEITDPYMVKVEGHERREDSPENPWWMLNQLRSK